MEYIRTANAPKPGAYNQGVAVDSGHGRFLFVSGQLGKKPTVPETLEEGEYAQTFQALQNILAIVSAAGGSIHSLARLDVFLKDAGTAEGKKASREAFNKAYIAFFENAGVAALNLPARSLVWVSDVPLEYPTENTLIEISAIAYLSKQ